jgi:hypothetical protein
MYYFETVDSVAQPFLHGANTPHYTREKKKMMGSSSDDWIY